jgi:potassium efflux system protein
LKVAEDHPSVLADPEPRATFETFGDSTLNFILRVYLPGLEYMLQARHELNTAIDRAFREANIEIAFPQRDLRIRSIDPPLQIIDERPGASP